MSDVKTYYYREHRIDLHPYAGGFKSFIFPPGGSGRGIEGSPIMVGPDNHQPAIQTRILQESRRFIDRHLTPVPSLSTALRIGGAR